MELAVKLQDQAILQAHKEGSDIELQDMTERLRLYSTNQPFVQ
jgi:hypothetical protein